MSPTPHWIVGRTHAAQSRLSMNSSIRGSYEEQANETMRSTANSQSRLSFIYITNKVEMLHVKFDSFDSE